MRRGACGLVWAISALLAGCDASEAPPLPEWRVVLGTDAPIPQFGDRLLIEVMYDSGAACDGCRRQLSAADPAAWPISFGVVPPPSGGTRVRVRLYRTAITGYDGSPGSDRLIDSMVRLPTPDGLTQVGITLAMSCFGVTDPKAGTTCDPSTGALGTIPMVSVLANQAALPHPGTWAPARRVPCTPPVDTGMVCIPGGAFLMGTPDYLPLAELDPVPEQLVQLSPFTLDVDEMTVGAIRPLVPSVGAPGTQEVIPYCTYTSSPSADGTSEKMPVNCVTLAQARAACTALGKRLPGEAEWEYAAGNLDLETRYPWGTAAPCTSAIVGYGIANDETTSIECLHPGDVSGPRPVGSAEDVTSLRVRDLAGNLGEWIDDDFQPYTDPACWGSQSTLHVNPHCHKSGLPVSRGGSWVGQAIFARVALRDANINGKANRALGFRCAR